MKPWTGILLAGLAFAGLVYAQDPNDILQQTINTPGVNYSLYGPATSKTIKDKTVQGGQALRVKIPQAGPDDWTVGASSPIGKSIAENDVIVVAFWARAPELKDGESMPLAYVGVSLSKEPYTQIVKGSATLTNQWQLHNVQSRANGSFEKGQTNVSMHLGARQGVIDLGPIFVLDLGPKP
ncbi:MAG TPA: hypothetical protein VIT67_07680 [Povalibacter sp.]